MPKLTSLLALPLIMLSGAVPATAGPTPAAAKATSNAPPDLDALNAAWRARIEELSRSPDPKLAANKRVALGFLFGLVLATEGKVDIASVAEQYMAPDYIQHDPNVPTGREGFVRWFRAGAMAPDTPTAPKVDMRQVEFPHMVAAVAEGDMVATVSEHLFPDPAAPGKRFHWFHLAMFRVKDGKLVEHWNEGFKGAYWCRLNYCDPPK